MPNSCNRVRTILPLAVGIGALTLAHAARAAGENAPPAARTDVPCADRAAVADHHPADATAPVRVSVLGGVGFPRPLAVDGLVIFGGRFAVGVEYGALPSTTIADVKTSLWAFSAEARFFPLRGAPLYLGLRAGRQHVDASTSIPIPRFGSIPEALSLDSWFVNPRIGLLWASHAGIAFGTEAGLQIPIAPSVSSTLPLTLVPGAQHTAESQGSSVLPTIDVVRLGGVL
jgi:hypothetical protein